jgi:SAM-dependent methyltransferase
MRWRSDGYLDASTDAPDRVTEETFESFGYEWTRFSAVDPEDERFWQRYFADVDLDWLSHQVALDAGCGKARYTRITARHTGPLVALDGSDAVTAAAVNLSETPDTVVVRADLRKPPFEPGSFGFVSCLGVLHHLADPPVGFDALARLVSPGGRLLVYLYSQPSGGGVRAWALRAATSLRRVTVRLPHALLRPLCLPLAALLYIGFVWPGQVGAARSWTALSRLPLDTYRGFPLRSLWLDTFDRLSAPIERRFTMAEVEPWFVENGLEVEAAHELGGLTIVGRRPGA